MEADPSLELVVARATAENSSSHPCSHGSVNGLDGRLGSHSRCWRLHRHWEDSANLWNEWLAAAEQASERTAEGNLSTHPLLTCWPQIFLAACSVSCSASPPSCACTPALRSKTAASSRAASRVWREPNEVMFAKVKHASMPTEWHVVAHPRTTQSPCCVRCGGNLQARSLSDRRQGFHA